MIVHGKGRSPSIMEREAGLGSLQLHLESSGGDGEERDFDFNAKGARRKLKVTSFPKQEGKLENQYNLMADQRLVQQYLNSVPTRASGSSSGGGL